MDWRRLFGQFVSCQRNPLTNGLSTEDEAETGKRQDQFAPRADRLPGRSERQGYAVQGHADRDMHVGRSDVPDYSSDKATTSRVAG